MSRYFFNIKKDDHPPDLIGFDLPDLACARLHAIRLMGEDLKDQPNAFWDDEEWEITVSDERGLNLFSLHCSAIRSPAAP